MKTGDKVKTSLGPGIIVKQEEVSAGLVRAHQRYLVLVDPLIDSTYFRHLQKLQGGLYFAERELECPGKKQHELHF